MDALTVVVDWLVSIDYNRVTLGRETESAFRDACQVYEGSSYISNELTVRGFVSTPSASIIVMLWLSIDTWYVGPQLMLMNRRRYFLPFCTGVTERATFGPPATRPLPLMVVALAILLRYRFPVSARSAIETRFKQRVDLRIGESWVRKLQKLGCRNVVPVTQA